MDNAKRKKPKNGEALAFIYNVAILFDGDECLRWPFYVDKKGRPKVRTGDHMSFAYAIICAEVNGPRPTDLHQVAHSCGNGHLACINPRHLRWATRKENEADKLLHGTRSMGESHGQAKLSEREVLQIISLKDEFTQRELGASFRVCFQTISDIQRGKRWRHLSPSH